MKKQENTNSKSIPLIENFKGKGILIGLPAQSDTPIYVEFYDRTLLCGYTGPYIGSAGPGKGFYNTPKNAKEKNEILEEK